MNVQTSPAGTADCLLFPKDADNNFEEEALRLSTLPCETTEKKRDSQPLSSDEKCKKLAEKHRRILQETEASSNTLRNLKKETTELIAILKGNSGSSEVIKNKVQQVQMTLQDSRKAALESSTDVPAKEKITSPIVVDMERLTNPDSKVENLDSVGKEIATLYHTVHTEILNPSGKVPDNISSHQKQFQDLIEKLQPLVEDFESVQRKITAKLDHLDQQIAKTDFPPIIEADLNNIITQARLDPLQTRQKIDCTKTILHKRIESRRTIAKSLNEATAKKLQITSLYSYISEIISYVYPTRALQQQVNNLKNNVKNLAVQIQQELAQISSEKRMERVEKLKEEQKTLLEEFQTSRKTMISLCLDTHIKIQNLVSLRSQYENPELIKDFRVYGTEELKRVGKLILINFIEEDASIRKQLAESLSANWNLALNDLLEIEWILHNNSFNLHTCLPAMLLMLDFGTLRKTTSLFANDLYGKSKSIEDVAEPFRKYSERFADLDSRAKDLEILIKNELLAFHTPSPYTLDRHTFHEGQEKENIERAVRNTHKEIVEINRQELLSKLGKMWETIEVDAKHTFQKIQYVHLGLTNHVDGVCSFPSFYVSLRTVVPLCEWVPGKYDHDSWCDILSKES